MQYLADTVAIIRHFARVGRIGKTAKQNRLIVASALSLKVPILTSNEIIRDAGIVDVVWT